MIHFPLLCLLLNFSCQQKFDVVRLAGSNQTNFVNPIRRDVTSLGNSSTDTVTIRFVTDNPGPWFLHWSVLLSSVVRTTAVLCALV